MAGTLRAAPLRFAAFALTSLTGILLQNDQARVAELADALDLGSSGENRAGSSPASRTI